MLILKFNPIKHEYEFWMTTLFMSIMTFTERISTKRNTTLDDKITRYIKWIVEIGLLWHFCIKVTAVDCENKIL